MVSVGMEDVTTGSGEIATVLTGVAGSLTSASCCVLADWSTTAPPPAAQKVRTAATPETASAAIMPAEFDRPAAEGLLCPANTSSRSPCIGVLAAKSRGTGPSRSGWMIRVLNTLLVELDPNRLENTSRGVETASKQASSTSRVWLACSLRLRFRSGISRSLFAGSIACVARFETPIMPSFSTPAMQEALKHLLPIRKWKWLTLGEQAPITAPQATHINSALTMSDECAGRLLRRKATRTGSDC